MKVLRRFPVLESALREGRLCLSTLGLLGPVLTQENLEEVLARAAFRTRAEVDRLVASLQPRVAPKDGIRRIAAHLQGNAPGETRLLLGRQPAGPTSPATATARPHSPCEPVPLAAAVVLSSACESPPLAASVERSSISEPGPLTGGTATGGTANPELDSAAPVSPPPSVPAALAVGIPEAAGSGSVSRRARPEIRPVSEESYSLRVTLDAAFKGELDQLRQLLSHKIPDGDLAAVLHEAVRCGIEKHGKRRGAVAPLRKVSSANLAPAEWQGAVRPKVAVTPAEGSAAFGREEGLCAASTSGVDADTGISCGDGLARALVPEAAGGLVPDAAGGVVPPAQAGAEDRRCPKAHRPAIPAAIRREVWSRDGGRCTWQSEDGRRCESRWQLELDHVVPVALGGRTTASNLRLACRVHNGMSAEQVFGREHMARFRRDASRQGEFATASGGAS
ncbi:MAG TPA: HNH endonuclease [Anaeromyxobacteraceae bacterium]|nr:HNH endonuclease [Anaeromyxobacteraceae bacterium]